MIEVPKKTEKAPISIYEIIAEVLGSIAGALFLAEMLSGTVSWFLSNILHLNMRWLQTPMSLLCFILVPLVYAYPIASKKLKLLLIPVTIMPICIFGVYYDSYPESILLFCAALAFVGAFGLIAGLLIRFCRSGKSKVKIVLGVTGSLLLLIPVLSIGYVFTGFPLHSIPVNRITREYVTETYADFDVVLSRTWYDWYDGKYVTKVHDRSDEDVFFEIWYITKTSQWNPTHIIDRYTYGEYWARKIKKILIPLLEDEYGDELTYTGMGQELFGFYVTVDGVKIGQPFSKDAPIKIEGNFSVSVKDIEPATLAAEFIKYRDFIEKNDFTFESYLFRFRSGNGPTVRIRTEYINDDLSMLIDYMQHNLNERGSYYDGERGLHYW